MHLSILQLNLYCLNFLDDVEKYLQTHSFDILNLQEVAGKDTFTRVIKNKKDNLELLIKMLGPKYTHFFVKNDQITSSPTAYFGNATFVRSSLTVMHQEIFWLYQRPKPYSAMSQQYDEMSRSVLGVQILTGQKPLWIFNTHLAWSKSSKDTLIKVEQGTKLIKYISQVQTPFVLTGDFNVDSTSKVVKGLEKYARNLTAENHLLTTLNPRTHRVKDLFPPGLAVDYIFVSKDLKVEKFAVVEEDVSDHFGLIVEIEI